METWLLLWYIAMTTNILVMIVQGIKSFKTKSVKDISSTSQLLWFATTIMWLSYAISINAMPNIILSTLSALYCMWILAYKYKTNCLFEL